MELTLKEAIDYAKEGKIDVWIQCFLRNEDKEHYNPNYALANGLLLEERFYYGPVEINLDMITTKRVEKDLEGKELTWYNKVVERMASDFNGENFPPLILEYKDEKLYLVDGNHRFSALRKKGIDRYYSVIWGNKELEEELISRFNLYEKRL